MILLLPFQAFDSNCSSVQKVVAGCAVVSSVVSVASACIASLFALEAFRGLLAGKIVSLLTKGIYTTVGATINAPAYLLIAATLFKVSLMAAVAFGGLIIIQKAIDCIIG